jgi:hypothetical protein
MQTFLPYPSFERSARCLDDPRLGNQRNEVLIILRTLAREIRGWQNHPAVRMWRGHAGALVEYGLSICAEWTRCGHPDRVRAKLLRRRRLDTTRPPWLGRRAFHHSHKSNLLRKSPAHYGAFGWNVPDDLPYVWPVD